jgi:hypothetical protein
MATNTLRPKKKGNPKVKASGRALNGAAKFEKALFVEVRSRLSALAILKATVPMAPVTPTVVAVASTGVAGQ